jgi:hypothetical protein
MMRRATHDYNWLCGVSGQFRGVSFGYDFIAEHEGSVQELLGRFGLDAAAAPLDTGSATTGQRIALTPADLWFHRYTWEIPGELGKAQPAAILVLGDHSDYDERHLALFVRAYDLQLWDNSDGTVATDVACSWSEAQFGLNVRGAANVDRLEKLHAALLAQDVAITLPATDGGVVRTGPQMTLID